MNLALRGSLHCRPRNILHRIHLSKHETLPLFRRKFIAHNQQIHQNACFSSLKRQCAEQGLYQPLRQNLAEIRVLLVEPGKPGNPLTCHLAHLPLSEPRETTYETVSYCWGPQDDVSTILVDGIPLSIPTNAKWAILRFRLPDRQRCLWIDSVCLNQGSDSEKGYQVARMHHIYKGGVRNLIWLGEDDGTVGRAIQILNGLLDDIAANVKSEQEFENMVGDSLVPSSTGTLAFDGEPMDRFFRRPWFMRLWVCQEAALSASNVCFCGQHELLLDNIVKVARWLNYKRRFLPFRLRYLHPLTNATRMNKFSNAVYGDYHLSSAEGTSSQIWGRLMSDLRDRQAHDPRDHVFGLLGMYQHFSGRTDLPELLNPDYSKSLAQVTRDATMHAIVESRSLECLGDVMHSVTSDDSETAGDWPSWIPRWHVGFDYKVNAQKLKSFFAAAGQSDAVVDRQHNSNTLTVKGFYVGSMGSARVQAVTQICKGPTSSAVANFLNEVDELSRRLSLGQSNSEQQKVATILMAGERHNHLRAGEEDFADFKRFQTYRDRKKAMPLYLEHDAADAEAAGAYRYYYAMRYASIRRRFFVTRGGNAGLGPQTMSDDDVVVILYGCRWPCVLRPRGDRRGYDFVGTCYVHDIMDGEALARHRARNGEDVWFTLV